MPSRLPLVQGRRFGQGRARGRAQLPAGIPIPVFDYVKLGPWIEACGPLTSPTTNQRLYRVGSDGSMEDITGRFRRKAI